MTASLTHGSLSIRFPGSCGLTDPCARIPSLSDLMQPLYCKVCDAKLNGRLQASAHYDGKSHHRRLRQYLEKAGRATDLQKLKELHQQKKVRELLKLSIRFGLLSIGTARARPGPAWLGRSKKFTFGAPSTFCAFCAV